MVCSNLTTLTPLRCTAWFVRAVGAAVRPDHTSSEPHDRIIQAKAEQQSTAQARGLAFEQPFALDRPSVFTIVRPSKLVGWQSTTILQPLRLTEQLRVPSIDRANRRFSQRPRIDSSEPSERLRYAGGGERFTHCENGDHRRSVSSLGYPFAMGQVLQKDSSVRIAVGPRSPRP